MTMRDDRGRRRAGHGTRLGLGLAACVLSGLAGCANLDDFNIKKMNFEVFRDPENPIEVIRTSKDGNERARALACLTEPKARNGTQQEQDVVVALLVYSAANESQPWCRVAAISALRKFKDPRAVEGLKDAYYKAGTFVPQTAALIRGQALSGLGDTGNPAAIDLLVRVLKEPPVDGPDEDRQTKLNERIVAARALGHFKHYAAAAALVEVLRTEKDPELRTPAHESLVEATGKKIPPDAQAWAEFLQNPKSPKNVAPDVGPLDRMMKLVGGGS
jgi:HEAT repeat protein